MGTWKPVTVAGGAYSDDTKPWSVQDCINLLPVRAERPGGRSDALLRGVPGLVDFATVGTGPIRGLRNVEGRLLVVSGSQLYQVEKDGSSAALGPIPGVSRVSMAHNQITGGNEVAIAATGGGYVYNTATGSLGPIADDGFPGAKTFDFIDGFMAFCEPFGRFWGHSQLAAATDYNTLDRYESETAPDRITTILVSHREVLAFNERTIDIFVNTGAATNTFARANGVSIDVGCIAKDTPQRLDNSVVWLGNDGSVYRLNGYTPQRISTGPIEQAISRVNQAQAFAMTFEDRGHKIYYLTFPDGQTWGWDAATNEWHRRQSYGLNRWRINVLVYWNKQWIGGDYSTGRLSRLSWATQLEGAQPLVRERIGGVLHNNQNRLFVRAVELVLNVGTAETVTDSGLSLSGDLGDGAVGNSVSMFYVAHDGIKPYASYSIISGGLPPGLSINASTGEVTGTRSEVGSFSWVVQVVDSAGNRASLADTAQTSAIALTDFDLIGLDARLTDINGYVISGVSTTDVVHLDARVGGYLAWNYKGADPSWPKPQRSDFRVTNAETDVTLYNPPGGGVIQYYATPEEAFSAFQALLPVSLTGSTSYTVWLYDDIFLDNTGGLSFSYWVTS